MFIKRSKLSVCLPLVTCRFPWQWNYEIQWQTPTDSSYSLIVPKLSLIRATLVYMRISQGYQSISHHLKLLAISRLSGRILTFFQLSIKPHLHPLLYAPCNRLCLIPENRRKSRLLHSINFCCSLRWRSSLF